MPLRFPTKKQVLIKDFLIGDFSYLNDFVVQSAEKYKLILTSRCINTKTSKCLEAYIDKAIYTEISFGLISFCIPL
ncbi:hypothetical protein NT017_30130 [Prolixibacter sp. NT017]|nr:hypothetical protein NT017_30130 [Prolixibacter sp. NT017]